MNYEKLGTTGYDPNYHDRQFASPYQSTISFCDWLMEAGVFCSATKSVCDMGCGKGANLFYMANRFPHCSFYGVDIDPDVIRQGADIFERERCINAKLGVGDLHDVGSIIESGQFDGIVSFQTLSWLPGYERALDSFISLSPQWIALTSLFYDGPIEAKTVISEIDVEGDRPEINRSFHYNTYSLPMVRRYLFERGYMNFASRAFEIPVDLPRKDTTKMGSYTEKTRDGRRIQISGPLLMNWYFILAKKDE